MSDQTWENKNMTGQNGLPRGITLFDFCNKTTSSFREKEYKH